ncbi:hypothetical protein PC110_g10584 [Phytophthora cactorum]|uniref:Uncharacterized protein n=1 Tax=Phytophthora cactorum TaxID=29920 RepID=A0A329S8E8_9STRA|nr:hypothetical protein PC110_g10584 [Phytophthora cactorum]
MGGEDGGSLSSIEGGPAAHDENGTRSLSHLHRFGRGSSPLESARPSTTAFAQYARVCFQRFGDRIKNCLTLNEPWCSAVLGYCSAILAPGRKCKLQTEAYLAGHNLLLAHARAVKVYRNKFQAAQKGGIGITLDCVSRHQRVIQTPMDQNVTEAAFLEEVSAFLNATDFSETNVGSERTARHAEAGINPSDTESSQEARDRISNDNQVSQHLTRRQTEVLRKRASRLEKLRRGSTTSQRYTLMNSSATGSAWRALAISRREQRYQAEGEKLRLEAAIDEQATYIAILRELLPKNVYDWVALNAVTRLVIISSRQANMQANHILFAEHLRQVFAAYTQLDAVFCGIDGLNGITSSLYSPKTDSTVESFRHFNNYTLPFSFKQTSEAWWQITNLNQWIKEDLSTLTSMLGVG